MKKVTAKAPVNIALIKYWGKKNIEDIVPYNASISISLDNLYTITTLEESRTGFEFHLDGKLVTGTESDKVYDFLKYFSDETKISNLKVNSTNYVPTAAGLASSASGFAALSVAANSYFETNYDFKELAKITRKGSGSACRSLLGNIVAWETNGDVYNIASPIKDFVMISVLIDKSKKNISSRQAMALSAENSPLYREYVVESAKDFIEMKKAIELGDYEKIGKLTKKSSLMMHGIMLSTHPPILYMDKTSIFIYNLMEELSKQGIYANPTMDAGPNVKILTREKDYKKVIDSLESNGFMDYYISRLGEGAKLIEE